jgi:peroxiredoxin
VYSSKTALFLLLLFVAGCGSIKDDLLPSGIDKQPLVQQGTTGPSMGQNAPDFTLSDTLGNPVTLSSVLPAHRGVVLYFNMWCPVCDSDMSYMRDNIIPHNPDVLFISVDYVSGSVAAARNAEVNNGYDGSGFVVLADINETVLKLYNATMGTTVVIDKNGVIQMNQDFWAEKLQSVLAGLP